MYSITRRILALALVLAGGAWAQCGPGETLRPIGGGRVSCANNSRVFLLNEDGSIGTPGMQFQGNAATVTNGVVTTGSYTDPAWLTLTKAKVGLANVENTALSTWPGTASITTIGTLASGTVPWGRLSSIPSTFAPSAHTHAGGDVTSTVATATALAANGANCATGSAAGGVDANGAAESCIVVNVRQVNFSLWDPNVTIPAATIPSVWRNELAGAITITNIYCESDTGDAVINFQNDDGTPANIWSVNGTCAAAGASGTSWAGNENIIAAGSRLDWVIVSGTAKRINVSIRYTY